MAVPYGDMIQLYGHPFARRRKPRRSFCDEARANSSRGKARASKFDRAATQSRERLEGCNHDQHRKGRNRSTDAAGLGKVGNDKKHRRDKKRRRGSKRGRDGGFNEIQLVICIGGFSVGVGNRPTLSRDPTGHDELGLPGNKVDHARPQHFKCMGAAPGGTLSNASGDNGDPQTGGNEKKTNSNPDGRLKKNEGEAGRYGGSKRRAHRNQDAQIKGIERIDILR